MVSPAPRLSHDYTEGATPQDIADALTNSHQSRRASQLSASYGEDGYGAVFDGPSHVGIPSSVSRMFQPEGSRRSSEVWSRSRRMSRESQSSDAPSPGRGTTRGVEDGDSRSLNGASEDEDLTDPTNINWRRSPSQSPARTRPKVFGNLANIFGRLPSTDSPPSHSRRPSISQLSSSSRRQRSHRSRGSDYAVDSIENETERWGYSSGEEDDDDDLSIASPNASEVDSSPPSPSSTLPLLSSDPIFGGETRIDMGTDFEPLEPPPPGPPSRQTIYIPNEDSTIRFVGYEIRDTRHFIWKICCVLTLGILALLGHWFPRFWLRWVSREKAFKNIKHGFVVVESAYRDIALFPLKTIPYPYEVSTVFLDTISSTLVTNDATQRINDLLVVDYRYARFALDPRSGLFSLISNWNDQSWSGISSVQNGLRTEVREQRNILFGPNMVDIESKSTVSLLIDEVIHPFYVFQIASILLWSFNDYYYYAFCIGLISAISVTTTLVDTKKTITRMRKMSRFSCLVSVFVDGTWTVRDSSSLVPGDIVNLMTHQLSFVPADMFLLSGDAIVDESMLTGESVPVSKIPVKDDDIARWKENKDVTGETSKSFLYSGTRVVRIRGMVTPDGSSVHPALGLVVRTGFTTTKGALVRSMLYPKPMGFKFYRDSVRFICVLACIAGLGFCASAVQFVRLGVHWQTMIVRAGDLITVVVPPALPATLSIGTSFSIRRLRQMGIFCISPSRINVAGKVNVCCFDKTGTLTEDGLDILGVRGLDRSDQQFGELLSDVHDIPLSRNNTNFLHALATCHSLKMVDGKVIGDPLDVKMFTFTRWAIEEGLAAGIGRIRGPSGQEQSAALVQTVVRPPGGGTFRLEDALKGGSPHAHFLEIGVIRTFEFVSQLRRMSVIVKRLRSKYMELYVKGAPEVMVDICDKDSFPQDYDDLLSYYTRCGYRVIAIAGKTIEGLSWLKAQRMKREQVESRLRFLGFVIFENKLKPGTTPTIQALRSAHLACRMITGDNPLTAVSVARECSLINEAAHVFSPVFVRGNASTPASKLQWSSMDEASWKLDDYSLKPLAPPAHHGVDVDAIESHDYILVVTGDVFRWMVNYAPVETLQRMLVKAHVFARMSPDEKNEVVERLQSLGYTVLMCGDGANDCAALKAADVGISLSEAEASVAAPFTSSTPDINCVIEVIKEGRSALVTSFSCFKYMALYSLIQFTTIALLYSFASSLGDFQFLYIDLFIIIPVAVAMARTLPYPRLHTKRPTASLVSKKVLTSIIGQVLITSGAQFWAFFWVRSQQWYSPPPPFDVDSQDGLGAPNFENSVLFLISCFQYILVAAVFSIGPPFRKVVWSNGWLMFALITLTLLNLLVLLYPPQLFRTALELLILPFSGRTNLLFAVVVNIAISMAFERWGVQFTAKIIGSFLRVYRDRRRIGKGKVYKLVEGGAGR